MNVPSVGVDAMSVPLPIMRGKKEWDNISLSVEVDLLHTSPHVTLYGKFSATQDVSHN